MKNKAILFVIILFFTVFFWGCKDSAQMTFTGDMQYLKSEHLGCADEPPLEKPAQEAGLNWEYGNNILDLYIDMTTHCEPNFINTVTFAGNTITIMMEDIAENAARCICTIREKYTIKVAGTTQVRVVCNVRFFGSEEFQTIIDQEISL